MHRELAEFQRPEAVIGLLRREKRHDALIGFAIGLVNSGLVQVVYDLIQRYIR